MKASEIREMTREEIERKTLDMKEELFNLRFRHAIGQLENTTKLKEARSDIARLKTIAREIDIKINTDEK
jgi:large subunit ribosomal protein L29